MYEKTDEWPTNRPIEPLAYSVEEAAIASNTSRTELYEAMRLNRLKAKKRGRRTLILPMDLMNYLISLPDYRVGRQPPTLELMLPSAGVE